MAVDTLAKRASALGFAFVATVLIVPDAVIAQADRQTAADNYGGIAASAPVISIPCNIDQSGLLSDAPFNGVTLLTDFADGTSVLTDTINHDTLISNAASESTSSLTNFVDSITEICR